MAARVSPTERLRAQIDEAFAGDVELSEALERVARLSVRLTFQTVLEEIVTEELGRERYERKGDDAVDGYRNGWQPPRTIKTTLGSIEVQRPKLRGVRSAAVEQLFGAGVARTNALECLVISGWVRGLSDRDIEAMLAETFGAEAAISRSTVSRICQRLRDEFEHWTSRDLSGIRLDYLFLDGSHFKMHEGARAEPVLAAWGIDTNGKPVFVGLAPATSESTDAWDDFLADLKRRGLKPPLLQISDGAPGLIAAMDMHFGEALRQRCAIHRCRNAVAKVSKADQAEFKADYWAIFEVGEAEPGAVAMAAAKKNAQAFADKWRRRYPAAVACVVDDLDSLLVHLRFPAEHWKRIRHSNFIERTFGETRRRVKVLGRLPGESSCVTLVWAVLDRASRGWRGFTMTPKGLRLLQDLRRELHRPPTRTKPQREAVSPAA
jgi:putative transposase